MNNSHYHKLIESLNSRRYMTLRYITAFLFFFNLYWMLALSLSNRSMIIVPLISFLTYIFAYADLYLVLNKANHKNLKWSKIVYAYNCFVSFIVLFITLLNKKTLFPFFSKKEYAIGCVVFILCLIFIAGFKIYTITHNKDKAYKKIESLRNQRPVKKGRLDV